MSGSRTASPSPRRTSLAARIELSWTTGGPLAQALRPIGALHAGLVGLRRLLYRFGWLGSERLPVPVIVVGNRVAGGAGKTPTTLALVEVLKAAGWRPGIVSRGHGGTSSLPREVLADSWAGDVGDEPALMCRRSQVPVCVGRQRAAAGRLLLAHHPDTDVIVCDDGLQHLALRRDLELVLFDERGAGNGRLLPAGPLREPIDSPSTARRQWVLYNAAAPSTSLAGTCARRRLAGLVRLEDWWQGQAPVTQVPEALLGHPVLASAGVGQPQRFFDALRLELKLQVQALALPDHDDHIELPWPPGTAQVIVTEKDAVKLLPQRLAQERPGLQVWVAPLALVLPHDLVDELLAELERICPRRQHGAAGSPTATR